MSENPPTDEPNDDELVPDPDPDSTAKADDDEGAGDQRLHRNAEGLEVSTEDT